MEKWFSGINFVLGLWLIVAPFWLGATSALLWSGVVTGIVVAVLSAYNYYEESTKGSASSWSAWIVSLFGLWAIVSPFVYSSTSAMLWSDVIAGIIVAVLAAYNGYDATDSASAAQPSTPN